MIVTLRRIKYYAKNDLLATHQVDVCRPDHVGVVAVPFQRGRYYRSGDEAARGEVHIDPDFFSVSVPRAGPLAGSAGADGGTGLRAARPV